MEEYDEGSEQAARTKRRERTERGGQPRPGRGGERCARRVARTVAVVTLAAVVTGSVGACGSGDGGGGGREPAKPSKQAQSGPAGTSPKADFNGDGRADVATTGQFGDHIAVAYGAAGEAGSGDDSSGGEDGDGRRQVIRQDATGTPDKRGDGVGFARDILARDLDSDGYTDLVADVETYGSDKDGGAKNGLFVLWGSPKGLDDEAGEGTQLRGTPKRYSLGQPGDDALAGGDFTGDGHTDLVVGVGAGKGLLKGPFTREGGASGTGKVPKAKVPEDERKDHSDVSDQGVSDTYAADLDGDGADDLISVHAFDDGAMSGGKYTSFTPGGREGFGSPDTGPLPGIDNATSGDVDDDGYADLILRRHPDDTAPDSVADGPVEVFYGSKDGPQPEDSRHTEIDQDTEGVPGDKGEDSHGFGDALDAGDVDGDGHADVAVGHPGEPREGRKLPGQKSDKQQTAGAVTLLKGGGDGLTGKGAAVVDQSTGGKPEDPETKDAFGAAVGLLDTDGDEKADLAVGVPGENEDAGEVRILRGTEDGFTGRGVRALAPEDFGIRDAGQDGFTGRFAR